MTASELNQKFALPGLLRFEEHADLTRAIVSLPTCDATIYLQGAHLTHWQPAGQAPVFFLSEHSAFTPGKAIRGGIPICFPWFGARADGAPGPSHGFARIEIWDLAFAALMPGSTNGDRLQLTFVLAPTDLSESLGFEGFRVAYELLFGKTLTLKLTVANFSQGPLRFEEALHAYFNVGDIHQTALTGLQSAPYLDKRDENQRKSAPADPLTLTAWTDRVFPANSAPLAIQDPANARTIRLAKTKSATTVVWNPWTEGAAELADLGDDEWPHFLCVEAANTATDAITLAPGESHTMSASIVLRPVPAGAPA